MWGLAGSRSPPQPQKFGSRTVTGSALSRSALVRGAKDDYTDDGAKVTECMCARDTVSTLCIPHNCPAFPISQMRNGGTWRHIDKWLEVTQLAKLGSLTPELML